MVEQAMIFALGLLTASLAAILLVPALARRAERLAGKRMRALFPVSLEEVAAERDHLRAEFAVSRRALEKKQEKLLEEKTVALSDAGKQLSFANALKRERDKADGRAAEIAAECADLKNDLAGALRNSERLAEELAETHNRLDVATAENKRLATSEADARKTVTSQRVIIADLEGRVSKLSLDLTEHRSAIRRLDAELKKTLTAGQGLQNTLSSQRAGAARLTDRVADIEKQRDDALAHNALLQKELTQLRNTSGNAPSAPAAGDGADAALRRRIEEVADAIMTRPTTSARGATSGERRQGARRQVQDASA